MTTDNKLTKNDMKSLINEAYNKFIKDDPIISKYTYETGYISGSSTYVAPVCLWTEDGEIVIHVNASRNCFKKRIEKIITASQGLIVDGFYRASDGSCPNTIVFRTNWNWLHLVKQNKTA